MRSLNYSEMDTGELIARFIDGARRVGGAFSLNFDGKLRPQSAEAQAMKQEIRAIASELSARRPLSVLRQLFDHESTDVRSWANGQFSSIDPEWASAGIAGVTENLTATEVMALRERALKLPPRRPALCEMTVDQLLARFEDAGIRRYGTQFLVDEKGGPDTKNRNRIVDEMAAIVQELKGRGALAALLPLLDHPNVMVRYVAATYCLPVASRRAIPVLETMVARRDPIESMHAADTLDRWRRGVFAHGT